MNTKSLSYTSNKNQVDLINDPFDLGDTFSQGATIVNHARALSDYADELVYNYAGLVNGRLELDIEKLSAPLQLELSRLYIESIDRDIEYACYGLDESINSDFLSSLLAMLKDDNSKTRKQFAQTTALNVFNYYKKTLQGIIDDACDSMRATYSENQDLYIEEEDGTWRDVS